MGKKWDIAVHTPLQRLFTYEAEKGLDLKIGDSVRVPFGGSNKPVDGWVVKEAKDLSQESGFPIKKILEVHPEHPSLSPSFFCWLQWISEYYVFPLGFTQTLVFPPLSRKTQGKTKKKSPIPHVDPLPPTRLNPDQENAVRTVRLEGFQTYLLHGVTGSGKTEVYIELIEKVIKQGNQAMVLVPEIALTPQLIRRFAQRFPDKVAVIHSQLTRREKTNQWWKAFLGEKKLLIGARSALFCPLEKLGLLIVDEEHETSFKQDETLKYNARDASVMRGFYQKFPVLLGSATPSLESWHNGLSGKYKKISMPQRAQKTPLPQIEIVDLRDKKNHSDNLPYWLSRPLYEKLCLTLEKKEQAALFLNRRGVAPSVQCHSCGFTYTCPNCDISLTLHGEHHLICHYCNYYDRLSESCPECKKGPLMNYGLGTETLEKDLLSLFPGVRVFRADRDALFDRRDLEDMVGRMESGQIDLLVGTQIIAKGLDFPNLTLVGVVHADTGLNIPDFRSSERSFQLNTQVSGRAGRRQTRGSVIIQTHRPQHPSLVACKNYDYPSFAQKELENRKPLSYPPFGKIAVIGLSGLGEEKVKQDGDQMVIFIRRLTQTYAQLSSLEILGPAPAPLKRIRNRFRYQVLIKSPHHKPLQIVAQRLDQFMKKNCKNTKCSIDIDPYNLL